MLEDGEYDAIVVDAREEGDVLHLELTILAGPRKGEVVSIGARGLGIGELDALGMPATVTVVGGAPRVAIDPV